ncbi:MAG: S-layer homology domain-containing protein [Synechococcales cyanobacterium RM1_1_8]|nr:S-layer homology domain-containing protein [Synechococcales cyanobacterium RM1_1_8]
MFKLAIALPLLTAGGASAQRTGTPPNFRDTANYWSAGCIDGMAAQGLMRGYPMGRFDPAEP